VGGEELGGSPCGGPTGLGSNPCLKTHSAAEASGCITNPGQMPLKWSAVVKLQKTTTICPQERHRKEKRRRNEKSRMFDTRPRKNQGKGKKMVHQKEKKKGEQVPVFGGCPEVRTRLGERGKSTLGPGTRMSGYGKPKLGGKKKTSGKNVNRTKRALGGGGGVRLLSRRFGRRPSSTIRGWGGATVAKTKERGVAKAGQLKIPSVTTGLGCAVNENAQETGRKRATMVMSGKGEWPGGG